MKVIIAGGRNYMLTENDFSKLEYLATKYGFSEIVSGGCSGADKGGEIFARKHNLKLKIFPADWKKHGRKKYIEAVLRKSSQLQLVTEIGPFGNSLSEQKKHLKT